MTTLIEVRERKMWNINHCAVILSDEIKFRDIWFHLMERRVFVTITEFAVDGFVGLHYSEIL